MEVPRRQFLMLSKTTVLILVLLHATAEAYVYYREMYLRSCSFPEPHCVPLRDCMYLEEALGDRSNALRVLSRKICGLRQNTVKVCCETAAKSALKAAPATKQTSRKNVHALYQQKKSLVNRENCGRIVDKQLLAGDWEVTAHFKDFPWTAILLFQNGPEALKSMCGGSLVSEQYVLTAAHCADQRKYKLLKVRFGFQKENCYPFCMDYSIGNIILHENYTPDTLNNDIALLYLQKPVQEIGIIIPVCLPIPEFMANEGKFTKNTMFTAIRYARDRLGSGIVPTKTNVILADDAYCSSNIFRIPDGQKCLISRGICRGDSGTALVYPVRTNGYTPQLKMFQMGIISSGYSDCAPFTPISMISVPYYLDWILKHVK